MKPGESILMAAAGAAAVSFAAGATSFIIAIIAAAHPPVSEYLTPAQNAQVASGWGWGDCVVALLMMAVAGAILVEVVLRRPLWSGAAYQRVLPLSAWKIRWSLAVGVAAVLFFTWRITTQLSKINSDSALSDGWSLHFLGSSFGTLSMFSMVLGSWLFIWFLDKSGWRYDPSMDLRLSWRLGRAVRAFAGK
jgi:hypothetical protein